MIIKGDSRFIPMKDESVNCIITSPPYWSLRKYDIPDLVWDGKEDCEHEWGNKIPARGKSGWDTFEKKYNNPGSHQTKIGSKMKKLEEVDNQGEFCLKCSAWRGQLGIEPTIDLYLKHLLQIINECKRVLRDDGTLWVNLGDAYSGSGCGSNDYRTEASRSIQGVGKNVGLYKTGGIAQKIKDIPAKSLCLIPYRFAIEMIGIGWILRNIINWHKPNCMPASVKDRFTVDFEPVFLFAKSKKYWFERQYDKLSPLTLADKRNETGRHTQGKNYSKYFQENESPDKPSWYRGKVFVNSKRGRNKRCVWTIPTQPYPESHFATFPEALVEPMIRAGCPEAGIVLDPFCGTGTVMRVAESLNRIGIGIDLGYEGLAEKRQHLIQKEIFT